MQKANFFKKLDKNQVQCELCNHFCIIRPNSLGVCGVRKNIKGELISLVYGHPTVLNPDPIEKKPLFHFLPGTTTLSLGTLGCNLQCANCQNYNISQINNVSSKTSKEDAVDPEKIIEEALGQGCKSISYTYNEPTVFAEYALEIMRLAHQYELKNVWVSNGFMSEKCLEKIIPYLDAINIDLKSFDHDFYKHNCEAKIDPILGNLRTIKQEQVHLEVTTLIIPTLNDKIETLNELAQFIVSELNDDTPWHISKFSSSSSWKLKNLQDTGDDIIYEAYEIGKDAGLKYVYVGNLPGDQRENSYCPSCRELVIRRMGYHVERLDNQGRCPSCDRNLDIIE